MQLGDIGAAEMEALLKQGMTPQQVVKILLKLLILQIVISTCVNCLWMSPFSLSFVSIVPASIRS